MVSSRGPTTNNASCRAVFDGKKSDGYYVCYELIKHERMSTDQEENRLVSNYALMVTNKRTETKAEGNKTKENKNYSPQPRLRSFFCDHQSVIRN